MSRYLYILFAIGVCFGLAGCASYSGVAKVAKGKVVVTKNSLFGGKVLICDVTKKGVSNCQEDQAP